jgi:hypothetical protein
MQRQTMQASDRLSMSHRSNTRLSHRVNEGHTCDIHCLEGTLRQKKKMMCKHARLDQIRQRQGNHTDRRSTSRESERNAEANGTGNHVCPLDREGQVSDFCSSDETVR